MDFVAQPGISGLPRAVPVEHAGVLWSLSATQRIAPTRVAVTKLTDLIAFNDRQLAARYAVGKIPMATLLEAYLDGAIDIPNMDAFIDGRYHVVASTITKKHL